MTNERACAKGEDLPNLRMVYDKAIEIRGLLLALGVLANQQDDTFFAMEPLSKLGANQATDIVNELREFLG